MNMNAQLANHRSRLRLRVAALNRAQLLTLVVLSLVVVSLVGPTEVRAANRPNFVLFLTDDQPYSSMGCSGNTVLKTPAIDQLAAEGVFFEKAFVTTAICCCSRASFLTGQHMRRHGVQDFERP